MDRDSTGWIDQGPPSAVPAVKSLRQRSSPAPLVQVPAAGAAGDRAGAHHAGRMAGSCSACTGLSRVLGRHPPVEGRGRRRTRQGCSSLEAPEGVSSSQGSSSDQKDKEREFSRGRIDSYRRRGSDRRRWGWARGRQGRDGRARPRIRPVARHLPIEVRRSGPRSRSLGIR
jgi:hypothetical protein